MLNDLKRIVLEACVLIAFGALFGLTLNHQLVMDAFRGQSCPTAECGRRGRRHFRFADACSD